MAIRVEAISQINETKGSMPRRFLFFTIPPELWMAAYETENHRFILDDSGRKREEVTVAGFIGFKNNNIFVDGSGSGKLQIGEADSAPVLAFIQTLKP